jgi:hypothetical protein
MTSATLFDQHRDKTRSLVRNPEPFVNTPSNTRRNISPIIFLIAVGSSLLS